MTTTMDQATSITVKDGEEVKVVNSFQAMALGEPPLRGPGPVCVPGLSPDVAMDVSRPGLPARTECTGVDGLKTVVEWYVNNDQQRVKRTVRTRTCTQEVRVTKVCATVNACYPSSRGLQAWLELSVAGGCP